MVYKIFHHLISVYLSRLTCLFSLDLSGALNIFQLLTATKLSYLEGFEHIVPSSWYATCCVFPQYLQLPNIS